MLHVQVASCLGSYMYWSMVYHILFLYMIYPGILCGLSMWVVVSPVVSQVFSIGQNTIVWGNYFLRVSHFLADDTGFLQDQFEVHI